LDLEREVEDRGMQLHAEAKREHFRIYATCMPQDVPKGLPLLQLLRKLFAEKRCHCHQSLYCHHQQPVLLLTSLSLSQLYFEKKTFGIMQSPFTRFDLLYAVFTALDR